MSVPEHTKVLVLNQDFTPLNAIHWKKAIKKLFEGPCERCLELGHTYINGQRHPCAYCDGTGTVPPSMPVEYFDAGYSVRDGRGREHMVPAVIANAHHIRRKYKSVPYSKPNIIRRDGFRCQFCGIQLPTHELTIDHVIPRSMWNGGGTPTCWTNIVAACEACNLKKADKTPEQAGMPLRKLVSGTWVNYKKPKMPTFQEISLGLTYRQIPSEWEIYVKHFRKSCTF